ncbi:unnamed protein product [Schistosoma haematobium]|nr:unnamed protein product [Schistosoma haematobium]CAH8681727.1 unnamed protein product [Schistosoma haematobium]
MNKKCNISLMVITMVLLLMTMMINVNYSYTIEEDQYGDSDGKDIIRNEVFIYLGKTDYRLVRIVSFKM